METDQVLVNRRALERLESEVRAAGVPHPNIPRRTPLEYDHVVVSRRTLDGLESDAWGAGVPLRICNAPRGLVLAMRGRHRRARMQPMGHRTMGIIDHRRRASD